MTQQTPNPNPSLGDIALEFLKYAPAYAQKEARQAIEQIHQLQLQGVIRNGLYYVVLVDLVGSTTFAAAQGNEALAARVKKFVLTSFNAFNGCKLSNVGLFVKEIGDAVLFVFQHFPDVLRWRNEFAVRLLALGEKEPMAVRICVHLGEVFLEGVNPLSIAVSQAFKMEKLVQAGHLVLTETAYNVAWPTIPTAYHGFKVYGKVDFDGYDQPVRLYQVLHYGSENE